VLREIANLGETADGAPSAPSLHAPAIAVSTVTSPAEARGERRHVTVTRNGAIWLGRISMRHRRQ
jgi:hypothetical protein